MNGKKRPCLLQKILKTVSLCLCGEMVFLLLPFRVLAQEQWTFLPPSALFSPLIANPQEPLVSILANLDKPLYEGNLGAVVPFLRLDEADGTKWEWGIFGSGSILLTEEGAVFPMKAGDWTAGMSLSEASGAFSNRLEFLHQSSHLGDSLQGIQTPLFFSRENFNLTSSFEPWDFLRLYAGVGVWENMAPEGKPFFASLGAEIYSPPADFLGTFFRGYAACYLKWEDEAGGVLDRSFQFGVQWKFKKEESRALRIALVYYDGNNRFGQFYLQPDEHGGIGVYFDP